MVLLGNQVQTIAYQIQEFRKEVEKLRLELKRAQDWRETHTNI
jgi:hypothetical protein